MDQTIKYRTLFKDKTLSVEFYSETIDIRGLDSLTILMRCSGVTDNAGLFTVEVTNDETDWIALEMSQDIALYDIPNDFTIKFDCQFQKARLHFIPAGIAPDGTATASHNGRDE